MHAQVNAIAALGLVKEYCLAPRMWALYDQTVVSAANFVVLLVLARRIGAEAFGTFALAYAVCLFLNGHHRAFFTQPFNVIGAGENARERAAHLSAMLKAHCVWIPLECGFIALAGVFFYPEPYLILAACFHLGATQLQDLLRRSWFTTGEIKKAFRNDALSYGGQVIAVIFLDFATGLSPATAFMALGATSLLAVIVAPMQGLRLRNSGAVWPRIVQHWSFGSWLILGVFAIWGAGQLYPFMLKMTAGEIAVGALLASRNLLNAIGVLIQSINSYLPSRAKVVFEAQGTHALNRYLRGANRKIAIIGCGFCFIVALWAPEILTLLYGTGYASGAQALRVLALGTLFSVFTIIPGIGLMALGKTKTIFLSNVAGTSFATTGGWYLVSRFGLDGAAASVTIGLALAFLIQGVALARELNAAVRPAK